MGRRDTGRDVPSRLDLIPPEVPDETDAALLAAEAEDPPVSIGRVSVFYA